MEWHIKKEKRNTKHCFQNAVLAECAQRSTRDAPFSDSGETDARTSEPLECLSLSSARGSWNLCVQLQWWLKWFSCIVLLNPFSGILYWKVDVDCWNTIPETSQHFFRATKITRKLRLKDTRLWHSLLLCGTDVGAARYLLTRVPIDRNKVLSCHSMR